MTKLWRCLFDQSVSYDNFAVFNTFCGQGSPSIYSWWLHLVIWDWTTLLTSANFHHTLWQPRHLQWCHRLPGLLGTSNDVTCYCWRQVGRPNMFCMCHLPYVHMYNLTVLWEFINMLINVQSDVPVCSALCIYQENFAHNYDDHDQLQIYPNLSRC